MGIDGELELLKTPSSLKVQVLSFHTQSLMPVLIGQCPWMCAGSTRGACSDWPASMNMIVYVERHHLLLIRMRTVMRQFPFSVYLKRN